MSFPLNKIGPFQFIRLEGAVQPPGEESELIQRPGVEGTGFFRKGSKGHPFQMQSVVDIANWNGAQIVNLGYASIKNNTVVDVVHCGFSWSSQSIRFVVLDVEVTRVKGVANSVGGLLVGANAIVEARWQLIAIKV